MPSWMPSISASGTAVTRKCGARATVTRARSSSETALPKTTSFSWRSWRITSSWRMARRPTARGTAISRSTSRSRRGMNRADIARTVVCRCALDRRKTAAPSDAGTSEDGAHAPERGRRRVAGCALIAAGLLGHAFFLSISIAGMQIALAVAAFGVLLAPPPRLRTPLTAPVIAFVGLAVISDLISPVGPPPLAFATLWRPAVGFFVVALGLRSLPEGWPERVLLAAATGLAITAAVGLLQYRTGLDPVHALGLRPEPAMVEAPGVPGRFGAMGFFTSRLSFGHAAALLVALLGGSVARRALAWPAAVAVAVGLAAVALTFDRAAYLGLCVAAAAIALRSGRCFAVLALVLAGLAALHPGVRGRFITGFSAARNADRVFIWSRATEII